MAEREESIEEFLARMSDSLVVAEVQPAAEADTEKDYKRRLIQSYLKQYFVRRALGTVEDEARKFNETFPEWRKKRAQSYRKMQPRVERMQGFVATLARITEELGHQDVEDCCLEMQEELRTEKKDVMPGTDESRRIDSALEFWGYIDSVVICSELLPGGNWEQSVSE